jgi:hypothetical protein
MCLQELVKKGVGFKPGKTDKMTDEYGGTATVDSPSEGNYGQAQGKILQLLAHMKNLYERGVQYLLYTALEEVKSDGDGQQEITLFPKLIGKQINAVVCTMIGHRIHLSLAKPPEQKSTAGVATKTDANTPRVKEVVRYAYIKPHQHPTIGKPAFWSAGLRLDETELEPFERSQFACGYIELTPTQGIETIFAWKEAQQATN